MDFMGFIIERVKNGLDIRFEAYNQNGDLVIWSYSLDDVKTTLKWFYDNGITDGICKEGGES